jgi:uncharacterized RDD family membrane protein YckC
VDRNPYLPPEADVSGTSDTATGRAASRWLRLAGALIDLVPFAAIVVPMMYFADAAGVPIDGSIAIELAWGVVSIAILVAIQWYPLRAGAQTWGKKLLGMQIVAADGSPLSLGWLLWVRTAGQQAINIVPVVGQWLALVDVLLIFGPQRRCLHDQWSGTRVVMID